MDTRFWGPSGWKMLHLITFQYDPKKTKNTMKRFLATLPFILPCKFCRASLTDYYEKHPYKSALQSRAKLTKWLYDIHNEVNAKLRSQNLHPMPDPDFKEVKSYYERWINESTPMERLTTYWDFLFSIAYCHPVDTARSTKPMPDCPKKALTCKSVKISNRWNTIKPNKRMPFYRRFWELLPKVLEPAQQISWQRASETTRPSISCRKSLIAWLWRMRCAIDSEYSDPYSNLCKTISSYSSDCGKASARTKTCRKRK